MVEDFSAGKGDEAIKIWLTAWLFLTIYFVRVPAGSMLPVQRP
jgi:hypothetical protein